MSHRKAYEYAEGLLINTQSNKKNRQLSPYVRKCATKCVGLQSSAVLRFHHNASSALRQSVIIKSRQKFKNGVSSTCMTLYSSIVLNLLNIKSTYI